MRARNPDVSLIGAALFAGAAAWTLQQQGGYIAASWVCGAAAGRPVWSLTAAALILLALGCWLTWRPLRRLLAGDARTDAAQPHRFLGLVALMAAALFLFAILLQAGAVLFLPGCLG
jgi:ABC-type nickel/cobalt efflux system permease component RcnA